MDPELLGLVVGGGVGLLGAAAGLSVPLLMIRGTFSRWLATRPKPEVAPVSKEELRRRLLALNDLNQPYRYLPDERYEVKAAWRITESYWWGFLQRNGLLESYQARIALNDRYREARIVEERGSIRWSGGLGALTPNVGWQRSWFKGVVLFERSWERAYGLRELVPLDWGRVVDYDFDVWRIKGPILRTVVESGWSFVPVVLEGHLRADRPLAG